MGDECSSALLHKSKPWSSYVLPIFRFTFPPRYFLLHFCSLYDSSFHLLLFVVFIDRPSASYYLCINFSIFYYFPFLFPNSLFRFYLFFSCFSLRISYIDLIVASYPYRPDCKDSHLLDIRYLQIASNW